MQDFVQNSRRHSHIFELCLTGELTMIYKSQDLGLSMQIYHVTMIHDFISWFFTYYTLLAMITVERSTCQGEPMHLNVNEVIRDLVTTRQRKRQLGKNQKKISCNSNGC